MTYQKPEVTTYTEEDLAAAVEAQGAGGGGGPLS
jgi:hypothetical protein